MLPPLILLYEQDSRATLKIPLLLGILLTTQQSLQETLSHTPSQHILEIWARGLSSFSTSCFELATPHFLHSSFPFEKRSLCFQLPLELMETNQVMVVSLPHIFILVLWLNECPSAMRLATDEGYQLEGNYSRNVCPHFFSSWNNWEMLLTGVL